MVRQWQTVFFDRHYSSTTLSRKTDFVSVAHAFGADGTRVTSLTELEDALKHAFNTKTPYVIDCLIEKDELVLPMLPLGGNIDNIITDKGEIL